MTTRIGRCIACHGTGYVTVPGKYVKRVSLACLLCKRIGYLEITFISRAVAGPVSSLAPRLPTTAHFSQTE